MNQQDVSPEKEETQPGISNRETARRQRRAERRAGQSGSWVLGAILILIGIFTLLDNLTGFTLENWWALFILIPAIGAFGNAWRFYQKDERLSNSARASLISGFLLTMVATIFLLNLNWTILGPILLVLAGLGLLVNVILPR